MILRVGELFVFNLEAIIDPASDALVGVKTQIPKMKRPCSRLTNRPKRLPERTLWLSLWTTKTLITLRNPLESRSEPWVPQLESFLPVIAGAQASRVSARTCSST